MDRGLERQCCQNAGLPSAGPPMGPPPPPPPIYDKVTIEFEKSKPLIKVAGVPPEEMRLDRYARTFRDSRIVGHERIGSPSISSPR